jgi:hypothetical protein
MVLPHVTVQVEADMIRVCLRPQLGCKPSAGPTLETLLERMLDEAVAANSIVVGHLQVGGWCRVEARVR